jgi:hypothetical protein
MLISMNKSIHPMSLRYLNSQGLHSNPFFARILLLDAPNDQQNYINVEPNELYNTIPSSTGDTVDSADATTAPESSNVTKRPRIALDTTDTNRQNSTNIHHDNHSNPRIHYLSSSSFCYSLEYQFACVAEGVRKLFRSTWCTRLFGVPSAAFGYLLVK